MKKITCLMEVGKAGFINNILSYRILPPIRPPQTLNIDHPTLPPSNSHFPPPSTPIIFLIYNIYKCC